MKILNKYKKDNNPSASVRQTITAGVKWSSASQMGRQGMHFITTAVLAHLLSPSDFGKISMALVLTGFLNLVKDLGTSAVIVQRKSISDGLLSSLFWANIAFGLFLTGILYLLSHVIAAFFHEAELARITQVLSLTLAISCMGTIQQSILLRQIELNKIAHVELTATLLGSLVGIIAAFWGKGVWSLVLQSLAVALSTTVLLWTFCPWRPKVFLDWQELKAVSSFSLNLTGFNIINYCARNVDYLLIGRFLGALDLGYYTLAYRLLLYPLNTVSEVIGKVMFPVYSQMQDNSVTFKDVYLRMIQGIAIITFPMMLGLMAISKQFVSALYGPQWESVTILIVILAPAGVAQSIVTTVGLIYQARGRTDWMFRMGIVSGIAATIAIVIGLKWGIVGVAIAYAIATVILVYPNFAVPGRLIDMCFTDILSSVSGIFFCSVLMAMMVWLLTWMLPVQWPVWEQLLIQVPAGILIYWYLLHKFSVHGYEKTRAMITR